MAFLAGDVIMTPLALIFIAIILPVTSVNVSDVSTADRNVENALNGGPVAVYRMVNFFLDSIVQVPYLIGQTDKLNIETFDDLIDSFSNYWDEWVIYWIGFVVCAGLGLTMGLVVLIACFVMPCCRCCGRCGGKKYKEGDRRPTRCKRVGCGVALGLISVALLLGVIPMFLVNEKLYEQIRGAVFTDASNSLTGVTRFLDQSVNDVNSTLGGGYIATQDDVFLILDSVSDDAMVAIDNATGILAALDDLNAFTDNLQALQTNLTESEALAADLQWQTTNLATALNAFNSSLQINCISLQCTNIVDSILTAAVVIDFTATQNGLTAAGVAINATIANGMEDLVNDTNNQVQNVQNEIDKSIDPQIADVKDQSKDAEREIFDFIADLDEKLGSLDIIDDIMEKTETIPEDDLYKLLVEVVYWVVVGLCSMIVIILALTTFGLACGFLLRPTKVGASCCSFDQALGSRLLMSGVWLTFVFYWVYCLFVVVFFLAGGLAHTEFCRHALQVNNTKHFAVLSIFDPWINDKIDSPDMDVLPFDAYKQCSANRTLYVSLNAEQYWNLTEMLETNLQDIEASIDELKQANISINEVSYASPELLHILGVLESAFGPNGSVDFDAMAKSIAGPVVEPSLTILADDLEGLGTGDYNNSQDEIDLIISEMRNMNETMVLPIERGKDELVRQMSLEQAALTSISFSDTADTINSSQYIINTQSDQLVGDFLDSTGDQIYAEVSDFATDSVSSVENDLARCEPLYQDISSLFDTTCVRTLYPINGFWFSLGWCLVFFVPYFFLAVNLATIFRYVPMGSAYQGSSPNSVGHLDDDEGGVEGDDGGVTKAALSSEEEKGEEPDSEEQELKALFYADLRQATESRASKIAEVEKEAGLGSNQSGVSQKQEVGDQNVGAGNPGDVVIS